MWRIVLDPTILMPDFSKLFNEFDFHESGDILDQTNNYQLLNEDPYKFN
jgi:hypothetical protein